jgi:phenylacetate-CoA ligase
MREIMMGQSAIYNPRFEAGSRDELGQLQLERLQSTLNRVYADVAFYRSAFDARRVNLEKVRTIESIRDLPFTTVDDLRRSYPYDMFAVPLRDIVRIHATSAAAAKPVVVGYTRNDLRTWTECAARSLAAAGLTEHDVVQIALDYCLFPGAFGFHQGAEQVGASVIPSSLSAGVDKQVAVMRDFKTTALISTPSHALSLASAIEDLRVHPEQLRLRLGLLSGERWGESLRRDVESRLHVVAIDAYGISEVMTPGVAGECRERRGLHVNEDHFLVEIVDPRTLAPAAPGEEGELVLTTLTKEGFPLIRYRTGDITSLDPAPCPCGRTLVRMSRVMKRTDDLILFRGVGFFPSQIEEILCAVTGAAPDYRIVLDRAEGVDTLEVRMEVSDVLPSFDEIKTLDRIHAEIVRRIKVSLDLDVKVSFAEPLSLRALSSGPGRVLDRRPS